MEQEKPTQADHEAAARVDRMMTEERCEGASPAHIGSKVWRIHCAACRQALVRAALSEAVRVAVEKERERVEGIIGRYQMAGDSWTQKVCDSIRCNLLAAIHSDAQATPAPCLDSARHGDYGHVCTNRCEVWRGTSAPEPEATHFCKVCAARWRLNPPTKVQPDGSWSLVYPYRAGLCCDNVAMGDQIERLPGTPPETGEKEGR